MLGSAWLAPRVRAMHCADYPHARIRSLASKSSCVPATRFVTHTFPFHTSVLSCHARRSAWVLRPTSNTCCEKRFTTRAITTETGAHFPSSPARTLSDCALRTFCPVPQLHVQSLEPIRQMSCRSLVRGVPCKGHHQGATRVCVRVRVQILASDIVPTQQYRRMRIDRMYEILEILRDYG